MEKTSYKYFVNVNDYERLTKQLKYEDYVMTSHMENLDELGIVTKVFPKGQCYLDEQNLALTIKIYRIPETTGIEVKILCGYGRKMAESLRTVETLKNRSVSGRKT